MSFRYQDIQVFLKLGMLCHFLGDSPMTMATNESGGARRFSSLPHHSKTWDLTHLSSKYPWLRVDDETLDEFRSPFQWVQDNGHTGKRQAVSGSGSDSECSSSDVDDNTTLKIRAASKPRRKRRGRDARYSLAATTHATRDCPSLSTSPRKRKRVISSSSAIRHNSDASLAVRTATLRPVSLSPIISPPHTARTETEGSVPGDKAPAAPVILPANVYSDFQSLKREMRQKPHQHQLLKSQTHNATKKVRHNILSLSFPVLHKPPPPTTKKLQSDGPSLARQLELLTRQELTLQRQTAQRIETEKAKLPLTFLFERNLDKTYCRQKCVTTITSIFGKLQYRMLFYAFRQWVLWRNELVDQERRALAVQKAQRRALAFFEKLASDAYVGTLTRAFQKWHTNARKLAEEEMRLAATTIQTLYRQRRARGLLKDLKQASMDREYTRQVEIQRLLRFESYGTAMKWSTLKNGFNLLLLSHCAKRITYFFRRICVHKRITRRRHHKLAATKIQCQWRAKMARKTLQKLRMAWQIKMARELTATVHMQRRARGYLARQHTALRRVHLAHQQDRVRVLQRAWRRYGERKELHERFQRRRRLLDEEQAKREELARIQAARQDEARRHTMAVHMQRVVRGFLGRQVARRRKHALEMDKAAQRIQQSWRRSKGRHALDLRFQRQKQKLEERRHAAVLLLQCRVRILRAKRQRDGLLRERRQRRASAIAIQRVVRGHRARHELAAQRRATVSIQSAWRGKMAREERDRLLQERLLREQQRVAATLKLQSVARGHKARRFTRQLRHEQQQLEILLQQSAVLIQKRTRGMEARKVALLLKRAMQVVDLQQRRAYTNSTQHKVNGSPLLAFLTSQYVRETVPGGGSSETVGETTVSYTREQQQWIQWQIESATQQMEREDKAVVLLQRHYRGYRTRVQSVVQQVQRRQRLALEHRMALTIQRMARGFLARRRVKRLKAQQWSEAIRETYIRERKWKDQERAFQDQYKQEQMALQLLSLQTLETQTKDAKREVEIAKWQAEAAAFRKQELESQLAAKRLEEALRGEKGGDGDTMKDGDDNGGALDPAWESVLDEYGNSYYYNTTTGESSWKKPIVVQPPSSLNTATKEENKDTATKEADAIKPTATPVTADQSTGSTESLRQTTNGKTEVEPPLVPEGFCCKCKAVAADKECLDCLPAQPDGKLLCFCVACFTLEHGLLGSKLHHDFKVLRALQNPSRCQHPLCSAATPTGAAGAVLGNSPVKTPAPASYFCCECPRDSRFSCEACFPVAHESAQSSLHIPGALHFRGGSLLCVECQTVLAMRHCTQCDEAFCATCFDGLHNPLTTSGQRKDHEFTVLEIFKDDLKSERDAYCVDCEIKICTKLCNLCGDGFCDVCFSKAHAKGQKQLHTWIDWQTFAQHGDWLEILDAKSGKTVFFNLETKESTHVQPFVLKNGDERHRVLFQERESALKKKALELESEIIKLKEHVVTLEQANDKAKEKDKRSTSGRDADAETEKMTKNSKKKGGLLGGLFSRKTKETRPQTPVDKSLSPDEAKRLALQQSILQKPDEVALINSKLKSRDREQKEQQAARTVGTKHFEQAMVEQLALK